MIRFKGSPFVTTNGRYVTAMPAFSVGEASRRMCFLVRARALGYERRPDPVSLGVVFAQTGLFGHAGVRKDYCDFS